MFLPLCNEFVHLCPEIKKGLPNGLGYHSIIYTFANELETRFQTNKHSFGWMLDIRWARGGEWGKEGGYHPGYLIIGLAWVRHLLEILKEGKP